jgi:hypothetical protein
MKKYLNEISLKTLARYLVKRGMVTIDPKKNTIVPSDKMQRLSAVSDPSTTAGREKLRIFKKTSKGTETALKRMYQRALSKEKSRDAAINRVRDTLSKTNQELIAQAQVAGQVQKHARSSTIAPDNLHKPTFKDIRKKARERLDRGLPPITHIEPDVPTQFHLITSAGRVMFSGSREDALRTWRNVAHSSKTGGGMSFIETNHPKVKVGAKLSTSEIKELEKITKRRQKGTDPSLEEHSIPLYTVNGRVGDVRLDEVSKWKAFKYLAKASTIGNAKLALQHWDKTKEAAREIGKTAAKSAAGLKVSSRDIRSAAELPQPFRKRAFGMTRAQLILRRPRGYVPQKGAAARQIAYSQGAAIDKMNTGKSYNSWAPKEVVYRKKKAKLKSV